jgi:uncharacterized protein YbjT (DUF2867 family)
MSAIVAVFGATGAQGGGLARHLLADAQQRFSVRAVTRRPASPAAVALAAAGARLQQADLDDGASLRHAMHGAHAAFCVTNFWEHNDPARELRQARNLAEAAAAAGVAHVIWSTLEDTREFVMPGSGAMPMFDGRYNVPHMDAKGEANHAFKALGVPTTFLYTSFYWDNLVHFGLHPRRALDGKLQFILPMDDASLPGIAAEDIGACAFGILARGAALAGKSIGIAGEHLSGAQMAEQLALVLGEPVAHVPMPPAQFAQLGWAGAQELASMFQFKRDFERRYRERRDVRCARELHPGVQTFAAWLARNRSRLPVQPAVAA